MKYEIYAEIEAEPSLVDAFCKKHGLNRRKMSAQIAIAEAVAERLEGFVKTEYIVARNMEKETAVRSEARNSSLEVKVIVDKDSHRKVDVLVN